VRDDDAGPDDPAAGLDPVKVELARTQGELDQARAELAATRGAAQLAAAEAAGLRAELAAARAGLAEARERAADGAGLAGLERRLDVLQAWVEAVLFEVCAHTAFASPKEERRGKEKAARQVEATAQRIAAELERRRHERRAASDPGPPRPPVAGS